MFKTIFLFEFRYRRKRAATYVYAGIIFLLCFLGVISPNIQLGSPLGQIYANAPYIIYRMTLVASFGLLIVNAAIMGVAVVRDADHRMEPLLFSTLLTKWNYVMGRFWGSFAVLALVHLMFPLGFICGFLVGDALPWEPSWRGQELLPFNPWIYLQSFVLILLPNLFFTSSLFFMVGTLGRKAVIVYSQGIFFLILYQLVYGLLKDMDEQSLAALIDPLGVQTFTYVTRYWTSAQQNGAFLPLEGMLLYNRLVWIGIGFVLLLITHYRFSFVIPGHLRKSSKVVTEPVIDFQTNRTAFLPAFSMRTYINQLRELAFFYCRMMWKEIPFLAIVGSGFVLFVLSALALNAGYGNSFYPTTSALLGLVLNSFGLFFLIIAILYSGELVWKERSVHMHILSDTLPVSSVVQVLARFLALLFVYAMILLGIIFSCLIIQVAKGYYVFELPVYFGTLYLALFADLVLYTVVFIFIQIMVNNKLLGFTLCVAFVIINALLEKMGWASDLWKYASGTLGTYSMMNTYGHFIIPFAWLKGYWLALSGLLFVMAILFAARGTDTSIRSRWKVASQRFTKPILQFTLSMFLVVMLSGGFIYINTSSYSSQPPEQAVPENNPGKCLSTPEITSIQLNIELYPSLGRFNAKGIYYLTNKSEQTIKSIPVQHSVDPRLHIGSLKFNHQVTGAEISGDIRYTVYELARPLLHGDSIRMEFQLSFQSGKFDDKKLTPVVINNGSFLDHSFFPSVSYKEPSNNRAEKLKFNDCDQATAGNGPRLIDAVIGTEQDQTVVGPGALQRKWEENERSYFHYKTEKMTRPSFFFASGRYEQIHEQWNDIDLEIYYHPAHPYNLQAMMKGMRDGLEYCTRNFGIYPTRRLCIVELPFYSTPASSYKELISFSENKEFIYSHGNSSDVNKAYEQTVRQVANQWWSQQEIPAEANQYKLLTDGLAAYSTLMVLKNNYPADVFVRYVSDQEERYLKARNADKQREQALESATHQMHVQQNKAAIAFYALQDYVGEDRLNTALKNYGQRQAAYKGDHPMDVDLVQALGEIIPDSLRTFYHDLFKSVTFYENSTRDVVYRENKENEFEILLSLSCEKIRKDTKGGEQKISMDEWIDIGIYSKDKTGRDSLIYLQKHRITEKDNLLTVMVKNKPVRAGIDPLHKLIDLHPQDNMQKATALVEIPNLEVDF